MNETRKDLSYYRSLPYARELLPSRESGFVASYPDLPGCAVQGETVAEALARLDKGRDLWLQAKLEDAEPIPEPPSAEPSGRLMLRVPVRLHFALDRLATRYGKSLNRLLNDLLFNHVNALPAWHGLGEPTEAGNNDDPADRRYAYCLTPDADRGFVAEHPDLPGCFAAGAQPVEAMAELNEARKLWLEARREAGLPAPAALSAVHTGAIHLRMPPALHADLVRDAQRNAASLNQMLTLVLADAVGKLESRSLAVGKLISVDEVPKAALLYQRGDRDRAKEVLKTLSTREREFTLGLMEFAQGSFSQAMEHFNSSYRQGLEFTEDAAAIYRAMPTPPLIDELFKQLLPFFQHPEANRTPMALSFLAWIERMRGNFEEAAEFLRKQRAAEQQAAA